MKCVSIMNTREMINVRSPLSTSVDVIRTEFLLTCDYPSVRGLASVQILVRIPCQSMAVRLIPPRRVD